MALVLKIDVGISAQAGCNVQHPEGRLVIIGVERVFLSVIARLARQLGVVDPFGNGVLRQQVVPCGFCAGRKLAAGNAALVAQIVDVGRQAEYSLGLRELQAVAVGRKVNAVAKLPPSEA